MLKALELAGFKSFADRTRFEFPEGITVIVGPNGSGKSNIVDAIKWVLGEQSAKSLRGKDMADVIFKGSGTSGRNPLNTAEATIIFDNADGRLAIDAPEVHITRRVYRSGEGEYLINRQPCRLKDIRHFFRGTGVGTDAYSLIEQGKVDRLLQASPRDRRAMFEEAAGISRFKAKKLEAQRRLERVDQNLLRLSDIVDEVGNRFRSVRSQAAKARRYREYSDRLQQLRTMVGMTEWRSLTRRWDSEQQAVAEFQLQIDEHAAQLAAAETRQADLESEVARESQALREEEHLLAGWRERIGAGQSTVDHETRHVEELETEAAHYRAQLAAMSGRIEDTAGRLQEISGRLSSTEQKQDQLVSELAAAEQTVTSEKGEDERLRAAEEALRAEHLDGVRRVAQLNNEYTRFESDRDAAQRVASRCQSKLDDLETERRHSEEQLEVACKTEQRLASQLVEIERQIAEDRGELSEQSMWLARRRDELALRQGRLSGLTERAALLAELERNYEGVTKGVRPLLQRALEQSGNGILGDVAGLVVDLLEVPMQWAPLVDAALGQVAQHVVLRSDRLLSTIEAGKLRLEGRVGFVLLDPPGETALGETAPGDNAPEAGPNDRGPVGLLSRLSDVVRVDAEYQPLVTRLLGSTWAVEMLEHAQRLRADGWQTARFVTLAGEVVNSDGTIVVGPKDTVGLVSRRTELRQLTQDIGLLKEQIAEADAEIGRLRENMERRQLAARRLVDERQQLVDTLAEHRARIEALTTHVVELRKEFETLEAERRDSVRQQAVSSERSAATRCDADELEDALRGLESQLHQTESAVRDQEEVLRDCRQHVTELRVEVAKGEQRLDSLRLQRRQCEDDQQERSEAIQQAQEQLTQACRRTVQARLKVLNGRAQQAIWFLKKDSAQRHISAGQARFQELSGKRTQLVSHVRDLQAELEELRGHLHRREMKAGEIRHARNSLADRLRDDYGIEIAELDSELLEQDEELAAAEQEIAALRRKISNIGAVNMEALSELDELESRYESLNTQFNDLTEAKESLERIIHKINADSRRLFSETLEAIRSNFRTLYRKAFGGGTADLVLDENEDILESGIDIVATPPGKPSFNNSLLSGGERALTAMALLLGIFQYRPSPFCVLDEVDAPFDEANIGRFVDVLREFLGWTKFVLVTHSKKTMTAANTLYGITMQESGVSKRVSVRFEDVSEDGQISDQAIERDGQTETDGGDDDERPAA